MSLAQLISSFPQRRVAVTKPNHTLAGCTPRQNHLIAALPAEDYARLLPEMEQVSLPQGLVIFDAHEREKHVYFPTGGVIAESYMLEDGASAAFAFVGNEGAIGNASFLGGSSMPSQSVVMCSGHAYRLPAGLLEREVQRLVPLRQLLLLHSQALITQIGQVAACNRHHALEQQLCRCLLTFHDRLLSDELKITQEQISSMLGVRREGISEAVTRLKRAGLICCSRGHITILDRPRLQARVCECYEVVRREYVRLLPLHIQGEVLLRSTLSKAVSGRVSD